MHGIHEKVCINADLGACGGAVHPSRSPAT
ncbi:MAG: hypothetical protein QOH60_3191 [Mycobacterium sp.]|nr:hypothetical protein [Mycobacterium sp.]